MDIRDLVKYAITGDSENFQSAFSSVMDDKAETAVAQKYEDMFGVEEAIDDVDMGEIEDFEEVEETVTLQSRSKDEKDFIKTHAVDKKDHPEAEESQFTSKAKKAKRKADHEDDDAVYEEVELEEAKFVPGNMKLKDGSSVKVSKDDVKALAGLFDELTGSNKKKMEDRMMSDKRGFGEILKFAKEAM